MSGDGLSGGGMSGDGADDVMPNDGDSDRRTVA